MIGMWKQLTHWLREHFKTSVVSAALAGGGLVWTGMVALDQTRTTRFEERMLAEFEKVSASEQAIAVSLERLSYDLSTGSDRNTDLVREMNSELVRMYVTLDSFKLGLDDEQVQKISRYQEALTEFKSELLSSQTEPDLQFLASRYADVERAYNDAIPVIERQIGKPVLRSTL